MTTGRRAGSAVCGRGAGGASRATAGAGSARPGSARPGPISALLAHLDGDRLRAPMREALAHLPGFRRSCAAPACRCCGRRVRGRFCSSSFASLISVQHHHPAAPVRPERAPPLDRPSPARKPAILCGIGEEPPAQRSMPDRCVYHMLAAKSRADLARRQHAGERHAAPHAPGSCGARPRPPSSASSSKADFPARAASRTCSNPATASPARRASPIASMTALRQQRLDAIR